MLDMSGCVDHSILLRRLQVGVGITGVVPDWITSFLTRRTQQVAYNSQLSGDADSHVWSAPRFSNRSATVCPAELSEVIACHWLNVHQYADDTQLYLSVLSDDASVAVERLDECLVDALTPGLEPAA